MALVADRGFRRNLGTGKSLSFVRGMMLATLQIVSFHAALFGAASMFFYIFLFIVLSAHFGGTANDLAVWILCSAAVVAVLSKALGAYKTNLWTNASPQGASIVLAIGHIAPIASAIIYLQMLNAGTGSGVVFIPMFGWAIIFYPIGIVWAMNRLASASIDMSRNQGVGSP